METVSINIEQATLVAIVALIITVVGQLLYIAYMFGRFSTKLEDLEKKQDKQNGVVERQFKTESDVSTLFEKVKVSNHRLQDLENTVMGHTNNNERW